MMNDIAPDTQPEDAGTNLRNFMMNRGAIIIKETRPIGTVSGEYGAFLEVETLALRIIRGTAQTDAFGALLTLKSQTSSSEEKVHLDFDEIDELIKAPRCH